MNDRWITALIVLCGTPLLGSYELHRRVVVVLALLWGHDPLRTITPRPAAAANLACRIHPADHGMTRTAAHPSVPSTAQRLAGPVEETRSSRSCGARSQAGDRPAASTLNSAPALTPPSGGGRSRRRRPIARRSRVQGHRWRTPAAVRTDVS